MAELGRIHSKSGQACVYFQRKRISLKVAWNGKGEPPEAAREKWKAMSDRVSSGLEPIPTSGSTGEYLVGDLVCDYLDLALETKRTDYKALRHQLAHLVRLHRMTPVANFGPLALAEFSQAMVGEGRTRQQVNRLIMLTRRVWRHGVSLEKVRPERLVALQTFQCLKLGRTSAPETAPRLPVSAEVFASTMEHIRPKYMADILKLMRLTGMRCGEVCALEWENIDTSSKPWIIRLSHHKTSHHGKTRNIPLSAKAQAILAWIPTKGTGRIWPTARTPRLHTAISQATKAAGLPCWSPNAIRKLVAGEVRQTLSLEHARALLGHTSKEMTASHYATEDLTKALEAVEKIS